MAGMLVILWVGVLCALFGIVYPIVGVLLCKACGSKLTIRDILRRL